MFKDLNSGGFPLPPQYVTVVDNSVLNDCLLTLKNAFVYNAYLKPDIYF